MRGAKRCNLKGGLALDGKEGIAFKVGLYWLSLFC
jgi:hypothetical protein